MMLLIPNMVCSCNGHNEVLVDSILDPACSDIAGSLALTLLFVLDQPHTRQLLRPSLDITRLLAVFTDTAAPDSPDREARRLAAHRCLVTMMRSWGGILALTEERGGLSSLVGVLSLPMSVKGASWGREAVFDLLLEVVGVVKANDIAASADVGRTLWTQPAPLVHHRHTAVSNRLRPAAHSDRAVVVTRWRVPRSSH